MAGAGYGFAVLLRRYARRGHAWLAAVVFVAALVGTVAAAGSFVLQYAIGGNATVGLGSVAVAMLGVHVLIGIGEGVITALTVGAVARVRPDLVHLLRGAHRPAVVAAAPS